MTTRRGSGAPAPKANRRTVTHGGAVSKKTHRAEIEVKVREIRQVLAAGAPVREDGELPLADRPMVDNLALAMVRHELMTEHIYEQGLFDERGDPTRALELLEKSTMRIAHLLDRMGMTPTARARLGLDLARAADLATAMSEPDAQRRRKMLSDIGVGESDADDAA